MTSSVYIAKNVYGGDGLGRLGDGRVVFVPGAWAGEQVRAEIVEEKRNFVRGRLVEVVEPSPERVDPGPSVPGMVYSGLSYRGECDAKERQLADFLERARIATPGIVRTDPPAQPGEYRNKVVYHFAKQDGRWAIGYRKEPSHEIVDIESDPLAVPEINAKLPDIRRGVMTLLTAGAEAVRRDVERKGNVTVRWTRKTGVKWWVGDPPEGLVLKETTAGLDFEVPADGFYQVNPSVGERLVDAVCSAYAAGVSQSPGILDLYCGVGVFGLACLRKASAMGAKASLIGVESGRQAVEFAKKNAAAQKAEGTRFFAERVGPNMRRMPLGPRMTVIVDPPRGGLEPGVARSLVASKAPRVFYVSCDPATLTRDLRELVRAYDVESVRWFDMFPRTARFETFVALRRRERS